MNCRECEKREYCTTTCEEVEAMVGSTEIGEDDRIRYHPEPRLLSDWQDTKIYLAKNDMDKDALTALRPLFNLEAKTRLVYLAKHYFGNSVEELSEIFKIDRSWVYVLLRRAKTEVGRVQDSETVS